jgi:uncharacterized protein (DUF1697 family)
MHEPADSGRIGEGRYMPVVIAMLRGINVSGHKPVKMEALRKSFEVLGFKHVRTYVQSGNVVFEAGKEVATDLEGRIEKMIRKDFGYEVPVLVRTAKEMEQVLQGNPLAGVEGIDETRLHVTFLADKALKSAARDLEALVTKPEQIRVSGREIYLYCPNGYGTSKISNTAIEKKLGVGATTRNWRSVNALVEMSRE